MKYIKLFEKFNSNTLSKLYKFLKKNVNERELKSFKMDLNEIAESFKIPLDKISESDIKYLSRRKALLLRNENKVDNKTGIWAIKFWFNSDGGYIGKSGTGNTIIDTDSIKEESIRTKFSDEQLDYIRKSRDDDFPKTGDLILVDKISSLKDGDDVIALLSSGQFNNADITYGKICKKNDSYYVVHNNPHANGSKPSDPPSGFRYGWIISNNGYELSSHSHLSKVIKSTNELAYVDSEVDSKVDSVTKLKPFDYNLMLDNDEYGDLILKEWYYDRDKMKIENDADFAVILYVDDILKRGLKSLEDTREERIDNRKGATALMSDEEFKDLNLKKYMTELIKNIGITQESIELKDLQKPISIIMCINRSESYPLFSIFSGNYHNITHLKDLIYSVVRDIDSDNTSSHRYDYLMGEWINIRKGSLYKTRKVKLSMNLLKEMDELKPLYDTLIRLNKKFGKYILEREINRGEDLVKIYFKIRSVYEVLNDSEFSLSYGLKSLLSEMYGNVRYVKSELDDLIRDNYFVDVMNNDIKRLEEIESYIDDIFK